VKSELGDFSVILVLDGGRGYPPPVFLKKRLQGIENKGEEVQKESQESSRAAKGLEGKEIEEVKEVEEFGLGEGERSGGGKEGCGKYSRAMIRRVSEVVNEFVWYQY
jgi:hypothetical protein